MIRNFAISFGVFLPLILALWPLGIYYDTLAEAINTAEMRAIESIMFVCGPINFFFLIWFLANNSFNRKADA